MTTTEALRTQLDSENQKLRSEHEAASRVVDLETELERVRQDSAELASELEASKAQVAEATQRATESEERVANQGSFGGRHIQS